MVTSAQSLVGMLQLNQPANAVFSCPFKRFRILTELMARKTIFVDGFSKFEHYFLISFIESSLNGDLFTASVRSGLGHCLTFWPQIQHFDTLIVLIFDQI